jgi:glycosyltransferase involved in cell wall biosynthesis
MSHSKPPVSVIVPFKDEEATIEQSIMSIVVQSYTGPVEILTVNDNSIDASCELVRRLARTHNRIRLIETTGCGEIEARNTGISAAHGKVIVNFSAHAVAARNFLEVLVTKLMSSSHDVAGVGCKHIACDAQNSWSLPFAEAVRSAFGAYGTTYYQRDIERFVNSVAYTAYKSEVFTAVGMFDPDALRAEDAEFNVRLTKAGFKLLYTLQTTVCHYEAASPRAFFARLVDHGTGRVKVIRKHPSSFRLIYATPSIALLVLSLLAVASIFHPEFIYPLFGLVLFYMFCSLFATVKITRRRRLTTPLRVMLAFPIIHVGYGLGFIKEIIWPSQRPQSSRLQ